MTALLNITDFMWLTVHETDLIQLFNLINSHEKGLRLISAIIPIEDNRYRCRLSDIATEDDANTLLNEINFKLISREDLEAKMQANNTHNRPFDDIADPRNLD